MPKLTHDESSQEIRTERYLLKEKGFDTAFALTPEYQEKLEALEQKLIKHVAYWDLVIGNHSIPGGDEIGLLQGEGTSWAVRSEVLARADAGVPTSIKQIKEMNELIDRMHEPHHEKSGFLHHLPHVEVKIKSR